VCVCVCVCVWNSLQHAMLCVHVCGMWNALQHIVLCVHVSIKCTPAHRALCTRVCVCGILSSTPRFVYMCVECGMHSSTLCFVYVCVEYALQPQHHVHHRSCQPSLSPMLLLGLL
jgi:hypothetical protein